MLFNVALGSAHAELSNFVVIGAFKVKANAEHFAEEARKNSFDAHFDLNPLRDLFYVYVLNTSNVKEAVQTANKLRKETTYWDTWVFSGELGSSTSTAGTDIHPESGTAMKYIAADDQTLPAVDNEAKEVKVLSALSRDSSETSSAIPTPWQRQRHL